MKHFTFGLILLISQITYATKTMTFTQFFSDSLETKFWKYFHSQVGNVDSFILSSDRQADINKKLDEYFPGLGLGILIDFVDGKKKTQFYITAYGDKTKFQAIEKIVKKSPQTDKYSVIALAPPSYLHDSLSFNGKTIPTDKIEFISKKKNGDLDISFFFPEKPSKTDSEFELAFQTLLLEYLGELEFTKLGLVDIHDIDKKQSQQTRKLNELYSVMTIDKK